mmetsp:Transcript_152736/g.292518  ORF Transcript_152736/g.292518 Transcript_152736/m.292518 type:complete len:385 (+) Transcript_152736:60-1214(+)
MQNGHFAAIPDEATLKTMDNSALVALVLQTARERDDAVQWVLSMTATAMQRTDPGWAQVCRKTVSIKPLVRDQLGVKEMVLESGDDCTKDSAVLVKCFAAQAAPRVFAAQISLTKVGLANPMYSYGLNVSVEKDYSSKARVPEWTELGAFAAKFHSAGVDWYEPYRKELQTFFPVLLDQPKNSILYPIITLAYMKGVRPEMDYEKCQEMMIQIEKGIYVTKVAKKLVTVHGQYSDKTVLMNPQGKLQLIDFSCTCVGNSVQDLINAPDTESLKQLCESYYIAVGNPVPTKNELYELCFDALVAEHLHYYVLMGVFVEGRLTVDEAIAHLKEFKMMVSEIRLNPNLQEFVIHECGPKVSRQQAGQIEKEWPWWTPVRGYRKDHMH